MHLTFFWCILALCLCLVLWAPVCESYQRVCYLIGNKKPQLELIEPNEMRWPLCTHVIFAFASPVNGTLYADTTLIRYIRQMAATANGTNVQLLVSVGGSNFDFVNNDTAIYSFADSVVNFLHANQLNGLDIDWEFPTSQEKNDFCKLLKIIRSRFDAEQRHSNKRYQLSVALSPILYIVEQSYHVPCISKYVDFVNLMTYDFHTPNTFPYTNHNSPLYASALDMLYFKYFNIVFSVRYIHSLGLHREQIMVGIPFYGYLYYLADSRFHGMYALCNGTQIPVVYNQICHQPDSSQTIRVFDRESKVPYMYHGNQWTSYDDLESVLIKSQWIADNGYGGSMTFALNYDDHKARCGNNRFPLQQAIYDILS